MVRNGYLLAINCNVSYTKFAGAQVRILVETGVNFRRDVETRSKATRAYNVMVQGAGWRACTWRCTRRCYRSLTEAC